MGISRSQRSWNKACPPILAVLLTLVPGAQALTPIPALPLSNLIQHKERVNTFPSAEIQLHQEFPEYIGFEVWFGKLYLAVRTTDPTRRQQILRRVLQLQANVLRSAQFHAGKVIFLLLSASPPGSLERVVTGIRGLAFTQESSQIGRTIFGLEDDSQRPAAEKVLREAGIPEDSYLIMSGPQHGLETYDLQPRLTGEYIVRLVMPSRIRSGETVHSSLIFRNTGKQSITLNFGTCLPPTEVREVQTGKLVLGIPWTTYCAGVGSMVKLSLGDETILNDWSWKAEFPDGRPFLPGHYIMRTAKAGISLQINGINGPNGVVIPSAVEFTVR